MVAVAREVRTRVGRGLCGALRELRNRHPDAARALRCARELIHGGPVNSVRMMLVVVAMLGGCTFEKQLAGDVGDEGPDAGEPKSEEPAVAPCKTPDPAGLVVCLEFEDSPSDGAVDDSSPARRAVPSSGLVQIARDGGVMSMAADVGVNASTYVAQDAAFDLPNAYTIAAWVKPDSVPANGTASGVVDREGQYAMIVSATQSGAINNRCQHTGVAKYEYTARLPVGTWSFMACTWDGTQLCAWRWASATDHEHWCHTPTLMPAATGTKGLAVGHLSAEGAPHHQFDGALDSVQVYSRGMSETQLCALAGQPAGCMPCDGGCL